MLFERMVPFFGTHYQKHWKNPQQLDISEINLNKNLFKIMIDFDFEPRGRLFKDLIGFPAYFSIRFSLFYVVWCYVFTEINKVEVEIKLWQVTLSSKTCNNIATC